MRTSFAWAALAQLTSVGFGAEQSAQWPQFRGPNGSGVAAEGQRPPVEFGPEKNLQWKVAVPSGLSSPIAVGDLLVLTAFEDGKLFTIAYRRDTGKEVWRTEAPVQSLEVFHKTEGNPAASTPATDGRRIVSYFGSSGVFCYDLTGRELWKYELPTAVTPGDFGSGVSPILTDGLVVLVRDEMKNARILALDADSGAVKWETKRQSTCSYATPVVWDAEQGKQIAAAGHGRMVGYDLKTGVEKWSVGCVPPGCCTSPVVADGRLFFAGSTTGAEDPKSERPTYDSLLETLDKDKDGALSRAEAEKAFEGFFDNQDADKDGVFTRAEHDAIQKFFQQGENTAFALKPGGAGDVTASHVLWKRTKGLPHVPSAIVYRGQFVLVKDGGIVTAYDAESGEQLYQGRVAPGRYYASPVAADGRIYLTSLDGAVSVIAAGSPKLTIVSKNPPVDERTSASPALADDTLYLRTDKHLYAFAGHE